MTIEPMTFEEMKTQAAADLRAVAAIFEEHAKRVDAGDMEAYYDILCEKIPDCQQMLLLRQSYRSERREVADDAATTSPETKPCTP